MMQAIIFISNFCFDKFPSQSCDSVFVLNLFAIRV